MGEGLLQGSHRRYNPLTGEWLLVSPHRAKRPWQGKVEDLTSESRPAYDPSCYLCPGNTRAGGVVNPAYEDTFVFDNDFAAIDSAPSTAEPTSSSLMQAQPERGVCRVVCFSPRHDHTLAQMSVEDIHRVVALWTEQTRELSQLPWINYVQIFENKGEIMGCSNPHPHGQIWAQEHVPNEPAKESQSFQSYFEEYGRPLLADYLSEELKQQDRLVSQNDGFVALVPFWAFWPFEVLILPRRDYRQLLDLTEEEAFHLAAIIQDVTTRYDKLFNHSFPYSAGLHQAPVDGGLYPEWRMHFHFYPPLLRSATVKKFRVGYELLAEQQRDLTPEAAAERLRSAGR